MGDQTVLGETLEGQKGELISLAYVISRVLQDGDRDSVLLKSSL